MYVCLVKVFKKPNVLNLQFKFWITDATSHKSLSLNRVFSMLTRLFSDFSTIQYIRSKGIFGCGLRNYILQNINKYRHILLNIHIIYILHLYIRELIIRLKLWFSNPNFFNRKCRKRRWYFKLWILQDQIYYLKYKNLKYC